MWKGGLNTSPEVRLTEQSGSSATEIFDSNSRIALLH